MRWISDIHDPETAVPIGDVVEHSATPRMPLQEAFMRRVELLAILIGWKAALRLRRLLGPNHSAREDVEDENRLRPELKRVRIGIRTSSLRVRIDLHGVDATG